MKFEYRIIFVGILLLVIGCKKQPCSAPSIDKLKVGVEVAQNFIRDGDPMAAIRTLEELNRVFPGNLEIVETLAFTHSSQSEHLEAAFYFEQAAKLDPEQSNFLLYGAQAYKAEKDCIAAVQLYKEYLELNPEDGYIWKVLGRTYYEMSENELSLEAYLKAIDKEQGMPDAMEAVQIGKLFFKGGEYEKANDWYEVSLYDPEARPVALLAQAELLLKKKEIAGALEKINMIEKEYPNLKSSKTLMAIAESICRHKEEVDRKN